MPNNNELSLSETSSSDIDRAGARGSRSVSEQSSIETAVGGVADGRGQNRGRNFGGGQASKQRQVNVDMEPAVLKVALGTAIMSRDRSKVHCRLSTEVPKTV